MVTDIDALIERLRDIRWPSGIMEQTAMEAAAALAELRDDCMEYDKRYARDQSEIVKLQERVNELEFALRSLADTDMPTSVREYARSALGEKP